MKGICFSELRESQNSRNNNKKNPSKLKAKLTGEAPHHASEQFVNEEAITECNSHLYAAAGKIGGWGWVFVRVCASVCVCVMGGVSVDELHLTQRENA